MSAPFRIVLVAPEIPQNTGSIGRLSVSTNTELHLVEPLGFILDDKHLRRAGMDYWPHLDLHIHKDWEAFLAAAPGARLIFSSTKAEKSFWDIRYQPGDYLVFGNESSGLPPIFYERYRENLCQIPMEGTFTRSLNLANAAGIVLYEALRQNRQE